MRTWNILQRNAGLIRLMTWSLLKVRQAGEAWLGERVWREVWAVAKREEGPLRVAELGDRYMFGHGQGVAHESESCPLGHHCTQDMGLHCRRPCTLHPEAPHMHQCTPS